MSPLWITATGCIAFATGALTMNAFKPGGGRDELANLVASVIAAIGVATALTAIGLAVHL